MTDTTIAAQWAALFNNPHWANLSDETREIILAGELALSELRLRRTIEDWILIGHACAELQQVAIQRGNSTNLNGRRHVEIYALIAPPRLRDMDEGNRSRAIQLYQDRDVILAWYYDAAINDQSDRDRMQRPRMILGRFDAYRKLQAVKAGERKLSPGLQLFDMDPALIDEGTRNFIEIHGADGAVCFIKALLLPIKEALGEAGLQQLGEALLAIPEDYMRAGASPASTTRSGTKRARRAAGGSTIGAPRRKSAAPPTGPRPPG